MSNLSLRFITAIILLPSFLFMLYANNISLYFLIFLFFLISIYEINFLLKKNTIYFFILLILIILFLYCLYKLRGNTNSDFYYLLWVMTVVWLSDIGGFLFGRLIKGPKLSKWSPNKTIAGFFGSVILGQFAFLVLYYLLKNTVIFNLKFFILQLLMTIFSVIGDLFFSFIKRKNDIKDYSNIFPGHGGLLDRADGLIFVIIVAYSLKIANVY
jgi:phosphatidate cytidylyltransferase